MIGLRVVNNYLLAIGQSKVYYLRNAVRIAERLEFINYPAEKTTGAESHLRLL